MPHSAAVFGATYKRGSVVCFAVRFFVSFFFVMFPPGEKLREAHTLASFPLIVGYSQSANVWVTSPFS